MNTSHIMKGGVSFMKINIVKILSVGLPLIGAGLSLATNWLDDKKLDDKVTEKVSEALANAKE